MKSLIRFFLSLNTTFALFLVFIILAFIGSLSLVNNLAFFSGIDETPLFKWLAISGGIGKTWWIYLMIASLMVLAASTIFCTIDALSGRMKGANLLLKLSPQIMHVGVLFIMLGHLLTASTGFKADITLNKGEKKVVAVGMEISAEDIIATTDKDGYFTDWEAKIGWLEKGIMSREGIVRPVHPVYFGNHGIFVRSVSMEPHPSVLLRVSRDPGALWALIGGIILSAGGIFFIWGRIRT